MKRIAIFILVCLAIFLTYRGVLLKVELSRIPPAGKEGAGMTIDKISRPQAATEFPNRPIFAVKAAADGASSSDSGTAAEGEGQAAGAKNELAEGGAVLRVKAIIAARDKRFAVLAVSGGKKGERVHEKLFEGDQVRGYFVEKITADHVELSRDGRGRIRLKIFAPEQAADKKGKKNKTPAKESAGVSDKDKE